jgi:hypothetical protein
VYDLIAFKNNSITVYFKTICIKQMS